MKLKLRKLWLKLHLYLGLTAGLVFALCGLTGSLIVFQHALDEQLNSQMLLTNSSGENRSLTEIIAAAEAANPDLPKADRIGMPRVANGVHDVRFVTRTDAAEAESTEVFVDPFTAEVLGRRVRNSGLLGTIYKLHQTLLAGKTGETIVGIVGVLVLISIATGIILWWPLLMAGWRAAWAIRWNKFNFDLHKAGGAAFTPVLALIAFTGIYLVFPTVIKPVVTLVSKETKQPGKLKSKVAAKKVSPLGVDQVVPIIATALPESRLMSIELPQGRDGVYRAYVRQDGEVGQIRGAGRIWIDQYSGEVLATRDWNKFTFADTYFRIQVALHSGDAFGLLGRCLFCIAGLVPATLFITGFSLWWRKLQARRRQKQALHQKVPHSNELVSTARELHPQ